MPDCPKSTPPPGDLTNENVRVALLTTLSLFGIAAEILFTLPAPETTLQADADQERFRLLSAAEAARGALVGHGLTDTPEEPSPESAIGGAEAALDWTEEDLDLHFHAALADWREAE